MPLFKVTETYEVLILAIDHDDSLRQYENMNKIRLKTDKNQYDLQTVKIEEQRQLPSKWQDLSYIPFGYVEFNLVPSFNGFALYELFDFNTGLIKKEIKETKTVKNTWRI